MLLATTALAAAGAFATVPAQAADMLSVGLGGYMEQWVGMADVSGTDKAGKATAVEGGVAQQSDSEFNVTGKLEADNGLTFSVKIEVEGNGDGNIDESQATVSGAFGRIVLGAEDPASTLTHHGVRDVGIGISCGDVAAWINGLGSCSSSGFGTAGHGHGDKNQISYYSPRMAGVQFGATYIPNTGQEGSSAALHNNDMDAWAVGGNYVGEFGGANIALSLGHYQKSQVPAKAEKLTHYGASGTEEKTELVTKKAYAGSKIDEATFSNFGLQVGFGAFSFDVAYAENDGGMYDAKGMKKTSGDWDTVGAGVMYSDGPMAVSLAHMATEWGDGGEQSATMLSLSYTLAPGVSSNTSIYGAERSNADKSSVEGTAFVTGIKIGF